MDSNTFKGNWDIVKGKVREHWGKLTDDDLTQIAGKKDQLIGKLEKLYGHTKEEAQRLVDEFDKKLH